ncbi:hypothetical protein OG894_00210 [Streptomyces sp. NBC_01724]|uniref:hypothetical protein n=1 Tax=unclassified Streptomyces TaxID=2593676 RepID=UPI002E3611C5|nr:hypothetical protein [Streptomyces sp. NBC_01724]WTE56705.1 hypothetical protein OG987_42350 [Streptomyces sp. NBC_01620]WTE57341.1 hypothetical protein OG784_00190 [Streptomyces sp. NBC_01617]WTI84859.1 hypothetical protein OHB17_00595 [Streptomyces sp. NBC_00724]WTE64787.1 hypothetical protein OG784_42155 [Streptomyces sp. NBC_01617]WTI92067.1 hypothetical protein OHB17_41410 [Streptomyces sp. NBC_00724]
MRQPESLGDYLPQHMNLTPDFGAGWFSVEQIADIALIAAAHSAGYAATSHLVSLVAAQAGLADQLMTAVADMNLEQRTAA